MPTCGELGTIVKIDSDRYSHIPYTFKGHIATFITSCIDADRKSDVSMHVNTLMAELHDFGSLTDMSEGLFKRRKQESIDLIGKILGDTGNEENLARRSGHVFQELTGEDNDGWLKIHNTLNLTSAHIALAAAAHGAWVVVECVSSEGSRIFPQAPSLDRRSSTFLVRLWLTQPPEHIRGVLRYTDQCKMSGHGNKSELYDSVDDEVVVVGGELEIATWVARKLGFQYKLLTNSSTTEDMLHLWRRGAACGRKLNWRICERGAGRILFQIERSVQDLDVPVGAVPLVKYLQSGPYRRLGEVARLVARIVYESYHLGQNFEISMDENHKSQKVHKALHFVITAMSIEVLRKTIRQSDGTADSYALNLSIINSDRNEVTGNLHNFFLTALHEGIPSSYLIMVAAAV